MLITSKALFFYRKPLQLTANLESIVPLPSTSSAAGCICSCNRYDAAEGFQYGQDCEKI